MTLTVPKWPHSDDCSTPVGEKIPLTSMGLGHKALLIMATQPEFIAQCSLLDFARALQPGYADPRLPFPHHPPGYRYADWEPRTPLEQTKMILEGLSKDNLQVEFALAELYWHTHITDEDVREDQFHFRSSLLRILSTA